MVKNTAVGAGEGVSAFPGKPLRRCTPVRFNLIRVTRGWVGVKFPGQKHYVTLEWPVRRAMEEHFFNFSCEYFEGRPMG